MGCTLSRSTSSEDLRKNIEKNGDISTAKKMAFNRPPVPEPRNGQNGNILQIAGKPIIEVESASQADFFRMLDDKINQGHCDDSDLDN